MMHVVNIYLPDAGTVTTSGEPTATSSTLLDTKATQVSLGKSFVNMKLVANADDGTNWAQFNTDALTANRTLTIPNQSLTLVGEAPHKLLVTNLLRHSFWLTERMQLRRLHSM